MLNSLSLRERHCPDQPCLRLSHPQLSHSSVPTLELRRGSSELDQRHSCYLVTLATDLLLPNLCGKVDFSVYFSFFFFFVQAWQIEEHMGCGTCLLGGCAQRLLLYSVHPTNQTNFFSLGFVCTGKFTTIIIPYVTPVFLPYMNVLILK